MSVPRRIVEQMLILSRLLKGRCPQGVTGLPLLGEIGVLLDELADKPVLTVVVGARDGVEKVRSGDSANGDVECGLQQTLSVSKRRHKDQFVPRSLHREAHRPRQRDGARHGRGPRHGFAVGSGGPSVLPSGRRVWLLSSAPTSLLQEVGAAFDWCGSG